MNAKKISEKKAAIAEKPTVAKSKSRATSVEWQSRRHDPTLGRYFKDLAEHEVLDSETESEAAQEIAELEFTLWRDILSSADVTENVLQVINHLLQTDPSFEEVETVHDVLARAKKRIASVKKGTRKSEERYLETIEELSHALYDIDLKRSLVAAAQHEIARLCKKAKGREAKTLGQQLSIIKGAARHVEIAKHKFIRANLRLVVAIARRYDRGQMPLIDLIQEGNLGLIKAVDRFDYRRGFRFSTYASWWIRHAIGRALADKGHAVRVPVHALDTQHRLARATESIGLKFGRPPTDEELTDATGLDASRLARARKHTVVPVTSLDKAVSESDDRKFVDLVVDEQAKSPFESTLLKTWTKEMEQVLDILTPIERTIIRWRYGLDDGEEMTLKEIGDHYNLSRERIRQLQQQALTKIRRRLELDAA